MVEATNRLYYGRAPGIDWFICQDTYTHGVMHSYYAFHTKGIIGMHRFNICLVVVLSLSCSGVKTP